MPEAEPLSPRKTALVLLIVGGCFAVLWPRLLQPALLGRSQHDPLAPNTADRAQGCCDVIFETDVNAIKIMTELCGNILERKSGPLDARTATAFASGKLPPDIIATCRLEVNATCGVDISTFLQQNVKLGKTYKQILEEVRSYNSSACLKMHFGVPTWELGSAHIVSKTWTMQDLDNVKQERPPHARAGSPHPAMRERGRAIPADTRPTPPSRAIPEVIERREGRVRSPLSVYYETPQEPPPIPGMRPPLGGAGGVLPPPKSSVGFVMPIYTICIVMFFLYTLMKILFKRTDPNYEPVTPDPLFRSQVFEGRHSSRASPEAKIVVSAISGLVAEVRQQMEASYAQSHRANSAQDLEDTTHSYTNGTVRGARDASPVRIVAKEYKEMFPEANTVEASEKTFQEKTEPNNLSPKPKQRTPEPEEDIPERKERTRKPKENTPERTEKTKDDKQSTPELLADALKEDSPQKENGLDFEKDDKEDGLNEEMSEEEIEYEIDDEEDESPLLRQLRASVEKEKATVKVLGMEMTAHCEGGAAWGDRPVSPPARPRPAPPTPRPHEAAEVSSIYLEGDIPQQSRLLVADSATSADRDRGRNDSPVVLSGKMTLSLINDEAKETPERDLESTTQDDDDFTTASAVTQPKQNTQQEEELSEEEIEEEVEEEMEVEEIEVEEDDDEPIEVVIVETLKTVPRNVVKLAPRETMDTVPTESIMCVSSETVEVAPKKTLEITSEQLIEPLPVEPDEATLEEPNKEIPIKPTDEVSLIESIYTFPIESVESAAMECIRTVIEESIKAIEPLEAIPTEPFETVIEQSIKTMEPIEAIPTEPIEGTSEQSFEAMPINPVETNLIESFEAVSVEHVKAAPGKSVKASLEQLMKSMPDKNLQAIPIKPVQTTPIESFEAISAEHVEEELEETIEETSEKPSMAASEDFTATTSEESLLQAVSIKPVETVPIESFEAVSVEHTEADLKETIQESSEKSGEKALAAVTDTALKEIPQAVSIKPVMTVPIESFEAVSVEHVDAHLEENIKETSEKSGEATLEDFITTASEEDLQPVPIKPVEIVPIESFEAIPAEHIDAVLEESVNAVPEALVEAILIEPVEAAPIEPLDIEPDETIEVSFDK